MKELKEIVATEESRIEFFKLVDMAFESATRKMEKEQDAFRVLFDDLKRIYNTDEEQAQYVKSFTMGLLQGIVIGEACAEMSAEETKTE